MRVAGRPGMQSAAGAWREKGYRDGLAGRDANTSRIVLDEHEAAYMAGHRQGTTARAKASSAPEPQGRESGAPLLAPSPPDAAMPGDVGVLSGPPSEPVQADAGSGADEQDEELG